MQTKLPDRGTQLDAETTTSSSTTTNTTTTTSINKQINHLDENDSSFDQTNTPKSKRLKFTLDSSTTSARYSSLGKFTSQHRLDTSHEYDLIDLTNDSPEKLECPDENEQEEAPIDSVSDQAELNQINLPPPSASSPLPPPLAVDNSTKALKELDSNDESLNRKKSLRTQIRTNQQAQQQQQQQKVKLQKPIQNQQQQPKNKFKKHQSASNIPSSTTISNSNLNKKINNNNNNNNTSTTTQTSNNFCNTNTNSNNTFACLRNLGSTCYINCIIQVMRYTPGFVNSIHRLNKQIDYLEQSLNAEIEAEINSNNNVKFVKNLHQLLEEMSEKEKQDRRPIYSPGKFVKTVWTLLSFWSNGSQQDAHEFLQYTIHFINECDLFLRKIHQHYHLKQQAAYLDDTPTNKTSILSSSLISTISAQPKTRQTKNSLKSANDLTPVNETTNNECQPPPAPPQQQQQPIKIDRRKKEFRNKENLIAQTESSTNNNNNNNNKLQIVNQKLSDRLIKSIPKIEAAPTPPSQISTSEMSSCLSANKNKSSTELDSTNFMRTPTKGGASLHVAINNSEDTLHCESDLVEPFTTSTSTSSISITNENANKKKLNEKLIDDKDLVSKCLRERLSNDLRSLPASNNSTNVSTTNNVSSKSKKLFKRATILSSIHQQTELNDNINSIIIIDSDLDEDDQEEMFTEYEQMEVNDENTNINNKEVEEEEKHEEDEEEEEQENININKAQLIEPKEDDKSSSLNESFKQVVISVEKFNLDKLLDSNKLRLSRGTRDYLGGDEAKPQVKQENKESIELKSPPPPLQPPQQRSTRNNLKKLTLKAKTFPDSNSTSQAVNLNDLDAITIINNMCTKPAANQDYSLTNGKSLVKSKLRANQAQQQASSVSFAEPIADVKSPFLLASNLMNKINESSSPSRLQLNDSRLPPSPAELLRKYSTNTSYTCEMDKLFKGSSITVTQCLECENLRQLPEAFYDRSIPLDTTTSTTQNDCLLNENSNDPNDETVNWIAKCLQNESYLNDNSKYMCDKCSSKQEARIHTQYTHMPNILILHLLPYGITSSVDGNLNAQKLSNRSRLVDYFDYICCANNSTTSMASSVKSSCSSTPLTTRTSLKRQRSQTSHSNELKHQFKLFAVVMHSGTTLNSGHYTAYVNYKIISQTTTRFNKENACSCFLTNTNSTSNLVSTTTTTTTTKLNESEWLHFDDTKVKSLSNLEFHRKIIDSNYDSPYILFYVKEEN